MQCKKCLCQKSYLQCCDRYQKHREQLVSLHSCGTVVFIFMSFLHRGSVCSPKILFLKHRNMIKGFRRNLRKWLPSYKGRREVWVSPGIQRGPVHLFGLPDGRGCPADPAAGDRTAAARGPWCELIGQSLHHSPHRWSFLLQGMTMKKQILTKKPY